MMIFSVIVFMFRLWVRSYKKNQKFGDDRMIVLLIFCICSRRCPQRRYKSTNLRIFKFSNLRIIKSSNHSSSSASRNGFVIVNVIVSVTSLAAPRIPSPFFTLVFTRVGSENGLPSFSMYKSYDFWY